MPAYCNGLKSNSRKLQKRDGKISMLDWGLKNFGSTFPPTGMIEESIGFEWSSKRQQAWWGRGDAFEALFSSYGRQT